MFVANACGKDATVKVPRTLSGTLRIPDPRQALCGENKTVRNKTTNGNDLWGRGRQVGERECQRPSAGLTVCLPCPQPAHAGPHPHPPSQALPCGAQHRGSRVYSLRSQGGRAFLLDYGTVTVFTFSPRLVGSLRS